MHLSVFFEYSILFGLVKGNSLPCNIYKFLSSFKFVHLSLRHFVVKEKAASVANSPASVFHGTEKKWWIFFALSFSFLASFLKDLTENTALLQTVSESLKNRNDLVVNYCIRFFKILMQGGKIVLWSWQDLESSRIDQRLENGINYSVVVCCNYIANPFYTLVEKMINSM